MKKVCVFLADGFEEIEGLTVVDILRRAEIETATVSVTGERTIHGAHGIDVQADALFEEMDFKETEMLVLPGGMPGTTNLGAHEGLKNLIREFDSQEKYLAAICAAPSVFGVMGILEGKKAVCYPGFEEKLLKAEVLETPVARSGHIITSRGMGTAIEFALMLVSIFAGQETADKIGKAIIYR